jgi:predicted ATP-grasp superfamily ATP-dependent carboligase
MLQEYIPGGDDSVWMFNGYFNGNSDCLLGIAGRKLRQHPVYTGATSLGICLHNQAVEETTKTLMKAVGYRGVLDIGYRYDQRSGQYKVLDINPRVGATFRLFVDENGMDVVRAMYLDMTGQAVRVSSPRLGRKWVVENGDIISFHDYHRDGKLTFFQWIRSFKGVQEGAWFAFDDLAPFGLMLRGLVKQFFRWLGSRFGFSAKPSKGVAARVPQLSE